MSTFRREIAASICLVVGLMGANLVKANDSTITCRSPPKESARAAFHPGTQVTYTQDNQASTCTFSVNGAVATSPPAEQVMAALNLFRTAGIQPPVDQIKVMAPAIAALISAAAPVDKVPDELLRSLAKADSELTGCLLEFFVKRGLPSRQVGENQFNCRGLAPYENNKAKAQLIATDQPAVGVPTLMISMKWNQGRFFSVLFLPRTIVEMSPIR